MTDAPAKKDDGSDAPKLRELRIIYVGDDDNYWGQLQSRFRGVVTVPVQAEKIYPQEDGIKVQTVFKDIIATKVDIIYIDFTKSPDEARQLARFITRNNLTKDIVTVGLLDHLADEVEVKKSVLTGVKFSHIKCAEINDVAFGPVALIDQSVLVEPQYATATMTDDVTVSELARINSVSVEHLVMEYNRPIVAGSEFTLQTDFLNLRMPSSTVKVDEVIESGFYYGFNHRFKLSYCFMDEEHIRVGEESAQIASKEEQIGEVQRRYYKWIEENIDRSKAKWNKVLIINKQFELFDESKKGLDRYPFIVRHQPFFREPTKEIKRFAPNIIAFQLERSHKAIMEKIAEEEEKKKLAHETKMKARADRDEEEAKLMEDIALDASSDDEEVVAEAEAAKKELEARVEEYKKSDEEEDRLEYEEAQKLEEEAGPWESPLMKKYYNDEDSIARAVAAILAVEDYAPVIVVFKSLHMNSDELREKFKYPKMIAHTTDINFDLLINMAQAMQKKIGEKIMDPPPIKIGLKDVPNHTVYFNKLNPHSIAEIEFPIVILTMKEHEITFSSAAPVSDGTVFKLKLTVEQETETTEERNLIFFITVVPQKKEGDASGENYRALIHGVGEDGKKDLRQFINSVFFREKQEKRKLEKEEFDKKNKAYADKKKTPPKKGDKK